jgi:hypothetical protein
MARKYRDKIIFTQAQKDEIIQMRKDGVTYAGICEKFRICKPTLHRLLAREGMTKTYDNDEPKARVEVKKTFDKDAPMPRLPLSNKEAVFEMVRYINQHGQDAASVYGQGADRQYFINGQRVPFYEIGARYEDLRNKVERINA